MKTVLENDRLPNGRVAAIYDGVIEAVYLVKGDRAYLISTGDCWPNRHWATNYTWIKLSTRTYYESIR